MSNRLTFSLASLIFILALGLVFAPVSVMAHPNPTGASGAAVHAKDGHMHPTVTVMVDDADPNTPGVQVIPKTGNLDDGAAAADLEIAFDVMLVLDSNVLVRDADDSPVAADTFEATSITGVVYNDRDGPVADFPAAGITVFATYTEVPKSNGLKWETEISFEFTASTATPQPTPAEQVAAAIKAGINLDLTAIAGLIEADVVRGNYYNDVAAVVGDQGPNANLESEPFTVRVVAKAAEVAPTKKAATVTVAANTYHGGGRFMVTFTFDATDAPSNLMESDIDPGDNARVLPGSIRAVETPEEGKKQWTAIIEPFLTTETGDITVTVMGNSVKPATTNGSVTVMAKKAAPTVQLASGTYALSGSLPAKGFGVITRAAVEGVTSKAMVPMMPDLQRFFAERGSITLYTTDTNIKPNDVVISEIMWGLNLSADTVAARDDHQWIELYNATGAAINLSKIQINFHRSFALPSDTNKVDQISNVERAGWTVDQGQNGSLTPGENAAAVNLVSMYRNINYSHVKTWVDKTGDLNRGERNKGIPNGRGKGSWKTSNIGDIFALNRIGSPGMEHILIGGDYGPTSVPRSPIVITEVGNFSGDTHDWIELTALANVNLEKYELQYVKSDKSIVVLAQFVKKQLNAGEILLVLGTHPSTADHPVAAGKEWKLADADRVNTGTASLYHVDSRMKLPDDIGKATFILRKEKGKTNHEHIIDLAGNLFISDSGAAYRTNLWPLRATAGGHGNVIDGGVEDFNSPRAYQRNNRGSGIGEKHWSVRGYTGVGYDRAAPTSTSHGTPGFDNGFVRDKNSALTGGMVSISEIMYEKVGNTPQWIELYNSSKTEAINLNEWKLRIENDRDDRDVDVRFRPTIQFGGVHIPPNQTVLIVTATTGQNSGQFPSQRIIDLWATEKSELEISNIGRNFQLLSMSSFKLTLIEKGGTVVDTVGNLGMDWELPTSEAGEGRSSVIRRQDTGEDGTMANAWVLAADTDLTHVPMHIYYGRRSDVGTPGYRAGGALPVSLSKFRPERMKDTGEIVIRWVTESELNNAGFNILRSETRNGEYTQLNNQLIKGQGTTSERTVYEYADTSAKPNVVYYYQIQDVSLDGQVTTLRTTHLRGNVTAVGKATTTWGELKALQ